MCVGLSGSFSYLVLWAMINKVIVVACIYVSLSLFGVDVV